MQRLWAIVDRRQRTVDWPQKVGFGLLLSGAAVALSALCSTLLDVDLPFAFGLVAVAFGAGWGGALTAIIVACTTIPAAMLRNAGHPLVTPTNAIIIGLFSITLALFGGRMTTLRNRARFEAQRASRREDYLQSIFEMAPAAMLITGEGGRVLAINGSARRIFALAAGNQDAGTVSDILGTPWDGIVDAGGRVQIERPDGRSVCVTLSSIALPLEAGAFKTFYIRDDTDSVQAAEQLALVQAELQQLARATALGQLGSAIAHELNQPLAAAANFAKVAQASLASGRNGNGAYDALEGTLQQIFRAAAIIKRLREFVHRRPLEAQWFSTRQVISDGVALGAFALRQVRGDLVLDVEGAIGEIRVDPIQIQQVILNIVCNAADAVAGQAVRRVTVKARIVAPEQIAICVTDTGPGIASGIAANVFTPFRTTKAQGLGVGLAICRTIVESHGGTISCSNRIGGGALFSFTLPWRASQGLISDAA